MSCPRARCGNVTREMEFLVSRDPAVMAVVQMIVAGIDRRYELHPRYQEYVEQDGVARAQELIRNAVEMRGACDIIQTTITLGGLGLFGGLSDDGTEFIFYEWTAPSPRFMVIMTHQEARDIVSGKQKRVNFVPCTEEHLAAMRLAKERLLSR